MRHLSLVLDSATCHKRADFVNACRIALQTIPPLMTNLLQQADVCWMRPIKAAFNRKWNEWFINEERELTRFNNRRSPGYAASITWLSEIWVNMDRDMIRRSFKSCGITSAEREDFHTPLRHLYENGDAPPPDIVEQFDDEAIDDMFGDITLGADDMDMDETI